MAAVSETYRVVVTREDGHWLADVPALHGAHTYARSLPPLDQAVREVVVRAADLPDEAMPGLVLEYDYHTGAGDGGRPDMSVTCTVPAARPVWRRLNVPLNQHGTRQRTRREMTSE